MDDSSSGDEESNGSIPIPIVPSFRLATLNIMDGRRNRLNAAIRCMEQANIDVGLLTETKLSTDMYTKSAMGYTVSATKAVGMSGGVALVHRQGKGWGLESIRSFGPNVIRATLVSGQRRWYIIGGYVSPNEQDGSTLACIQQAWESCRNRRWPVITLGDFNVDLGNPQGTNQNGLERRLETAALMDTMGMTSMRDFYRQCKKRMRNIGLGLSVDLESGSAAYATTSTLISHSSFSTVKSRCPEWTQIIGCSLQSFDWVQSKTINGMFVVERNIRSNQSVSWKETELMVYWKS